MLTLHGQFAHPSKNRLINLLTDAGVWKDNYTEDLTEIQDTCTLCKNYKKTPLRPVVVMPMAHEFNGKVAMDLKKWKGCWIDMWSRYRVSVFINTKRPDDVVDTMITH